MKHLRIGFILLLCLLTLGACSKPRIDEKYAAEVVRQELSLPGPVAAQKMHDGYSGSELFVATAGSKKYVIKFLTLRNQELKRV